MSEMQYDCTECRRREAVGKFLVNALQRAIDAREQTSIDEQETEHTAWRARAERRDELCEKLTPAIIDALMPLAAEMAEGEPISIRVGWKINLTLGSKGVAREDDEGIPF